MEKVAFKVGMQHSLVMLTLPVNFLQQNCKCFLMGNSHIILIMIIDTNNTLAFMSSLHFQEMQ